MTRRELRALMSFLVNEWLEHKWRKEVSVVILYVEDEVLH